MQATFVSPTGRDVTDVETPSSVVLMNPTTELLTKRRAVDFCRVATALCRAA
ncbi:putative leader peptide [Nonomuraea sp. NPDC048882]